MRKTVFSGLGIAPVVAYAAEKGGESLFKSLFGPSKEFQERQAVREEYQGYADAVRAQYPDFPYHDQITQVIARGATQSDLNILKAEIQQYETQKAAAAAAATGAVSKITTGATEAMAGFSPWLIAALAGVVLMAMRK